MGKRSIIRRSCHRLGRSQNSIGQAGGVDRWAVAGEVGAVAEGGVGPSVVGLAHSQAQIVAGD